MDVLNSSFWVSNFPANLANLYTSLIDCTQPRSFLTFPWYDQRPAGKPSAPSLPLWCPQTCTAGGCWATFWPSWQQRRPSCPLEYFLRLEWCQSWPAGFPDCAWLAIFASTSSWLRLLRRVFQQTLQEEIIASKTWYIIALHHIKFYHVFP